MFEFYNLFIVLIVRYRGCWSAGRRNDACRKDFTPCSSSTGDSSNVPTKGVPNTTTGGEHQPSAPCLGVSVGGHSGPGSQHAAVYAPLLRGDSSASNAALIGSSMATGGFLPPPAFGTDDAVGNRNAFGSVDGRKSNKDVKEWFV